MKNFIIVSLLMVSSASWAQTATPQNITKIYTFVQQMPQFAGGKDSLAKFIKKNLHYPIQAKQYDIEGTVYLTFLIDTMGEIGNIKVLQGVSYGCSEEAVRLVKSMPNWAPGKQNGRAVDVQYNLSIAFQLNEN